MKEFKTSKGDIVEGDKLNETLSLVADKLEANARAIREENAYASHIKEIEKRVQLEERLAQAERVRAGVEPVGFWLWQLINTELTGDCVAFLPKT